MRRQSSVSVFGESPPTDEDRLDVSFLEVGERSSRRQGPVGFDAKRDSKVFMAQLDELGERGSRCQRFRHVHSAGSKMRDLIGFP